MSDAVIEKMRLVLANSFALGLKTQNYHWNVTGPLFQSLHTLFEEQYDELFEACDEIAERIRALGASAPGSFAAYNDLITIEEASADTIAAEVMLQNLLDSHKQMIISLTEAMQAAQESGDEGTADLMIERLQAHDKHAWMLKSSLG